MDVPVQKITVRNTAVSASPLSPRATVGGVSVYKVPAYAKIVLGLNDKPMQGDETVHGKKLSLKRIGVDLEVAAEDEVLVILEDYYADNAVAVLEGGQWPEVIQMTSEAAALVPAAGFVGTAVFGSAVATVSWIHHRTVPTTNIPLDTSAPMAPTLTLGADMADGATAAQASAPGGAVTVTAEAGSTTVVSFTNGTQAVSKTVTGTGAAQAVQLSAQDLIALGDGTISVTAVSTDAAGNASGIGTSSFTLDTSAPMAPTLTLDADMADGATAAQASAPGGAVTVTAEAGSTTVVSFTNGTQAVSKTVTGTGAAQAVQLSAQDLVALGDGTISVTAVSTDAAGNASGIGTSSFTLDTSAPMVPADPPAGYIDNTGSNTSNNSTAAITDETRPGILVGANLADVPTLYVDGQKTDAIYNPVTGALTPRAPLPLGPHTMAYTLTDAAGNESGISPALSLRVDSSVPVLTVTSIAGDAVGLTGNGTFDGAERGSDSITVSTLPVFSGTSANLEGQTVTVTVNNTHYTSTVQTGGAWSVALTQGGSLALNHGNTYNVYVSASNPNGNNAFDAEHGLVVNTAQPDVPTVRNSLSSTVTPVLTGVAQKFDPSDSSQLMALEVGDTLQVTLNGVALRGTIGDLPTGLDYDAATKTWRLNTATAGSFGLQNGGVYDVAVQVVTGAGTVTKDDVSHNELVINTDPPSVTLNPLSTDGYINSTEANQALTMTGSTTAEVGAVLTVTGLDGATRTTQVMAGTGGINTFSLNVSAADMAAISSLPGSKTVTVSVTNPFGLSASHSQNVTIDTVAPSTPASPLTDYEDNAGGRQNALSTAAQTDDTTPGVFVGTGLTDTPKLYVNGTRVDAIYDSSTGTLTPTAELNHGSHHLTYTLTDAAGNESGPSPTLTVIVDTWVQTPSLALASDAGDSSSDGTTNVGTVTVTGLESGATWQYSTNGGSTWTTGTGSSFALAPGTYAANAVQVQQTDLAGNVSSAGSVSGAITVDIAVPSQTVTTWAMSADTGFSATDWVTNTAVQTLSGTLSANLAAGESVQVSLDNGVSWTDATASEGSNTWLLAGVTLVGSDVLQVRVKDLAGNNGMARTQVYTVETDSPDAPVAALSSTPIDGGTPTTPVSAQGVNTTTAGSQSGPITVETSTGYFVAWYGSATNGANQDPAGSVYGQFYNLAGSKIGSELSLGAGWQVNGNPMTKLPALTAAVVNDGANSTVLLGWQAEDSALGGAGSSTSDVVYAMVSNTAGVTSVSKAPAVANTTTATYQSAPVTVALDNGSFMMLWHDDPNSASNTGGRSIRGQVIGGDGAKVGSEFTVGTWMVNGNDTWSHEFQPVLHATRLVNGNVVVSWQPENSGTGVTVGGTEVAYAVVSNTGSVVKAQALANTTTAGFQGPPVTVATLDGGCFVTWFMADDSTGNGQGALRGQYLDASGNKVGSELVMTTWAVNEDATADMPFVSAVALANGDVLVGFQTENGANGHSARSQAAFVIVKNNQVTPTSTTQALLHVASTTTDMSAPVMVALRNGGFFAAWYDKALLQASTDVATTIYGQYFDKAGAQVGNVLTISTSVSLSDAFDVPPLSLAELSDNNVVVTWQTGASLNQDGSGSGVYQSVVTYPYSAVMTGTTEAHSLITIQDGAGHVVATTTADGSGHYSVNVGAGTGVYEVTATDAAGNVSQTTHVVDDAYLPTVIAAALSADTGASATDFVTTTAAQTISGTLNANLMGGAVVSVSLDNGNTWLTATAAVGSNTWSLPDVTLSGSNTLQAKVTFKGVDSAVYSRAYVVGAAAPTFTSASIDLATASDNGLSATDNATTVQTPTVTATFSGVSDVSVTTTFYDDKDNSGTYTSGDTVLASGVTTTVSAGTASASATLNLADGSYRVKAFLADLAGNASTASATLDNANKSVVVSTPVAATSVGGAQTSGGLGLSLNSAGDFNGDGFEDFIVSAPQNQYLEWTVNAADIYLIYGTANGIPSISNIDSMTATQGIRYTNSASGHDGYTGTVVKGIGDLNGDGYSDIVIGGLLGYNYVLWGGANKAATLDLATMNTNATSNGFMMDGSSEWFGSGMASADLNQDGLSDLIIGDSNLFMTTDTGVAYVVYGHTGAWTNMVGTTTGMTGATGAVSVFKGGMYFGDRIGVVGDVNGDGYVDFVVNAPSATGTGGVGSGVSTLVFGTATGYPTTGVIDLGTGTTSTTYGIKISGSETYEYLGDIAWDRGNTYNGDALFSQALTVSSIGDFNGDGVGDMIIGSQNAGDNGVNGYGAPGRAYVFYGHAGAWSDMTASTAATAGKGFILTASNVGANASLGFAVAGGGDYNKDGYADFLVTAVQASTNGLTNNGAVWLVFGKSGGHSGTVDLTTLVANGQALQWDGAASYNFMGTNVAMGDWNQDGYADVAIPQWKAQSNGAAGAGAFKIYYGNAVGAKGPTGTTPVTLDLNGDGQIGYSHVVLDVDGDGQKDLTAWTDAQDGVLVWDKLGDGVVHDNSQWAFAQYGGHTDLQGLAAGFDTNADGVFDTQDARFGEFAVWQDANQNGVSDAGEVQSLADMGVASIHLRSDGVLRQPHDDVAEYGRTEASLTDGSTMVVADTGFDAMSLTALVQQANGTQRVDLSQDAAANTLEIDLSDVLAADRDVLVVTAGSNDVVRLDTGAWMQMSTTTTVGEHTYALWANAGAHLLIDDRAWVQTTVL